MDENPRFKAGLAVRKAVLGEDYVNKSLANADAFMTPIQQFLTENAWGTVWTRPGLDLKTRSLLNLAMLTALNRPNELKLHLKGALNNGVSKEEIVRGLPAGRRVLRRAAGITDVPIERLTTAKAHRG